MSHKLFLLLEALCIVVLEVTSLFESKIRLNKVLSDWLNSHFQSYKSKKQTFIKQQCQRGGGRGGQKSAKKVSRTGIT